METVELVEETRPLGESEVQVTPLGIGAWSWGDKMIWGYGRDHQEEDVHKAYLSILDEGLNFLDTAEIYGLGMSERLVGKFIKQASAGGLVPGGWLGGRSTEAGHRMVVATKFAPFPWRLTRVSLLNALYGSLKRLQMRQVDLYQIHFPIPTVSIETWMDAMAEAVELGLTRAVGVSNYNEEQMRRAHLRLQQHSIPLAANQVEYSLLDRQVEFNGLLQACLDMNITLIAYSPLAQGLLTGKYTPENPPPGIRGRRNGRESLAEIQPLLQRMKAIGEAHGGKTPAQVALNWTVCKGTVPIPGAKNAKQARENTRAIGWRLNEDEVAELDVLSQSFTDRK